MMHQHNTRDGVPIVQGTAVDYHSAPSTDNANHNTNYGNDDDSPAGIWYDSGKIFSTAELRQQRQDPPHQYKDVAWAVAFGLQAVLVIFMCLYLMGTGQTAANAGGTTVMGGVLAVVGVCGFLAIGLTSASLSFMSRNAEALVQAALVFSVATSFFMGVVGLLSGNWLMGVLGCAAGAIGVCYAYFVWKRIPFAAANLRTALQAVRSNMGLMVVALGVTAVAMAWSTLWFTGVGQSLQSESLAVVFLLFLSYYWTHEVLRNTMHVTTAGVVGTWWFVPQEANQFWSTAVRDSWGRATSYSFGSICFGSFLVALVRALRALERHARDNDELTAVACVIQCILGCIEGIIEYFNQWAYVFVAMYGMGYIEAGRNVIHLFEQKGWTVIITDDLADNVLFMMSVGIALFTGLVGWIWGSVDPGLLDGWEHSSGPACLIGFVVGLLVSSILLGVVNSAINTVIVCYADAPSEFQMNHPELSAEMRGAWSQAWPGLVD